MCDGMLSPEDAAVRLVEYSTPILAALAAAQMTGHIAGVQLTHLLGHMSSATEELAQWRSDRQRLVALLDRHGTAAAITVESVRACLTDIATTESSCDGVHQHTPPAATE